MLHALMWPSLLRMTRVAVGRRSSSHSPWTGGANVSSSAYQRKTGRRIAERSMSQGPTQATLSQPAPLVPCAIAPRRDPASADASSGLVEELPVATAAQRPEAGHDLRVGGVPEPPVDVEADGEPAGRGLLVGQQCDGGAVVVVEDVEQSGRLLERRRPSRHSAPGHPVAEHCGARQRERPTAGLPAGREPLDAELVGHHSGVRVRPTRG